MTRACRCTTLAGEHSLEHAYLDLTGDAVEYRVSDATPATSGERPMTAAASLRAGAPRVRGSDGLGGVGARVVVRSSWPFHATIVGIGVSCRPTGEGPREGPAPGRADRLGRGRPA